MVDAVLQRGDGDMSLVPTAEYRRQAATLARCLPLLRDEARSLVECCAVPDRGEDGEPTPRLPLAPEEAAYIAPRLAAIRAAEALVGRPDDGCPAWLDAMIDAAADGEGAA